MELQLDKNYPAFQGTQGIVTVGTRARVSQMHLLYNFNRKKNSCVPLIQHTKLIQSKPFPVIKTIILFIIDTCPNTKGSLAVEKIYKDKQCTYNVTLSHVRANFIAVESQ
jgi:hypothetical protein